MAEQRPAGSESSREPNPSVLIVDDEPSIRAFLAFVLEDEGFHVVTAGDGHEALQLVEQHPPDVVVTDLMMPQMDGYDLIERLRQEQAPVKAIIAMSAINVAKERRLDADLFLAKPFDVDQVVICVQSLLECPPPRADT